MEPAGIDQFLGDDISRDPAALTPVQKTGGEPAGLDSFLGGGTAGEPPGLDEFVSPEEVYGTGPQQTLAGVEGVLRGATLGGSDVAERALHLSTPEAMLGRREANPWTSGIGTAAGATGTAMLTGGGSLIAEGLGGGALAGAIGLGTEGVVFGLGNTVSDAALGDPDLNAQKVLSHIGWGAALGAGLGAITGGLGAFSPRAGEAVLDALNAEGSPIIREANVKSGPYSGVDDLQARVMGGIKTGESSVMPQQAVLQDIAPRLSDLKYPPHPIQLESLASKDKDFAYRVLRESDTKAGKLVQDLEGLQKRETGQEIDKAIESLSPHTPTSTDEVVNGNKAVKFFTNQYEATKKKFAPLFEQLDKIHLGDIRSDIDPFMDKLAEKVPGVARMFNIDESGYISGLEKYSPAWGIEKATYNAVKDTYKAMLGAEGQSFSVRDFLNVRKGMGQHVNFMQGGDAAREIGALKAAAMDYIQQIASEQLPEGSIREAFKSYAINEQNRELIEKTFGAQMGEQGFSRIAKPKEYILGKIFRDSETTKAAKAILPPHQFDELLANHLAEEKYALTKNGVFSSNRFYKFLKDNRAILGEAMSHNPQKLQRLNDLTTFSTIVPDNASINPSGTAKTIFGMLKNAGNINTDPFDTILGIGGYLTPKSLAILGLKKAAQAIGKSRAENAAMEQLNYGLVGKAAKQIALEKTQKVIDAVNANLDRAAKAIFKVEEPENAQ